MRVRRGGRKYEGVEGCGGEGGGVRIRRGGRRREGVEGREEA